MLHLCDHDVHLLVIAFEPAHRARFVCFQQPTSFLSGDDAWISSITAHHLTGVAYMMSDAVQKSDAVRHAVDASAMNQWVASQAAEREGDANHQVRDVHLLHSI